MSKKPIITSSFIFLFVFGLMLAAAPGAEAFQLYRSGGYTNPMNVTKTGQATAGQIVINSKGQPCVTWADRNGNNGEIYFACKEDQNWHGLINQDGPDNISGTTETSIAPRLIMDNQDRPIVAWIEKVKPFNEWVQNNVNYQMDPRSNNQPKYKVSLKRWNGTSWVGQKNPAKADNVTKRLGISALPQVGRENFSLALNPQTNQPAVVWENSNTQEVYFRYYNGNDWVGHTGSVDNISRDGTSYLSLLPDIEFSPDGRPYVVWASINTTGNSTSEIHLSFWNGQTWRGYKSQTFDRVTADHAYATTPEITISDYGRPILTWMGRKNTSEHIFVRSWNGQAYRGLTGAAEDNISGNLLTPRSPIIENSLSGAVGVAFTASPSDPDPTNLYYIFWDGQKWAGKRASGPDQVTSGASPVSIDLALDYFYQPHLIWQEGFSTDSPDIFYTRWFK